MIHTAELNAGAVQESSSNVTEESGVQSESRLSQKVLSVKFQRLVFWLTLAYIGCSSVTLAIGILDYHNRTPFYDRDPSIVVGLNFAKLCMSLVFLVEILLRMRVEGARYWLSWWNIIDMSVVLSCMAVELLATFKKNASIVRYDWLLMSFRMWYAARMIRIVGLLKGVHEEKRLVNEEQLLQKCQDYLQSRRSDISKMEEDLSQMHQIITSYEVANGLDQRTVDLNAMNAISSTWNRMVPQNASIKLKSSCIKKVLSSNSIKK